MLNAVSKHGYVMGRNEEKQWSGGWVRRLSMQRNPAMCQARTDESFRKDKGAKTRKASKQSKAAGAQ